MNVGGFSLPTYRRLLEALIDSDFECLTVAEYLRSGPPARPYVVLRHDVDRWADRAVEMARLEARHDVQSTYYFRTATFAPDVATEVSDLGHEVGYHYEDYVRADGDPRRAHAEFARNLHAFREHVTVETVCAHGSPLSSYTNYEMWRDGQSLADYELLGEGYLSIDTDPVSPDEPSYCSDTGREWTVTEVGYEDVSSTEEFIAYLAGEPRSGLYLLAHPSRWPSSLSGLVTQLAWDTSAQTGKKVIGTIGGESAVKRGVRRTVSGLAKLGRTSVMRTESDTPTADDAPTEPVPAVDGVAETSSAPTSEGDRVADAPTPTPEGDRVTETHAHTD